jgi:hypothetical protein
MGLRLLSAALAVALVPLAGCGTESSSGTTSDAPSRTTSDTSSGGGGADASAQVACRHWRNVAGDAASGILSDDELRAKVQEVHSSARVSEEHGIASHAQGLLAAVTQRDSAGVERHAEGLSQACLASGAFN